MKNNRFLLFIFLLLGSTTFAQNKEALSSAKVINTTNAKAHLSFLASDALRGREAGTADGDKAAQYIADYYKKIGVKGAVDGQYLQKVNATRIHLSQSLQVKGRSFKPVIDFFNMPSSISLSGFQLQTDSILFAGYG
ncbi:hypothetical protein OKW96_12110 [Sphingobacterium sp. KU25419]|nr:hypothetical protein OKW96_12110 [Sphingobacterium sp. KU25419]